MKKVKLVCGHIVKKDKKHKGTKRLYWCGECHIFKPIDEEGTRKLR